MNILILVNLIQIFILLYYLYKVIGKRSVAPADLKFRTVVDIFYGI